MSSSFISCSMLKITTSCVWKKKSQGEKIRKTEVLWKDCETSNWKRQKIIEHSSFKSSTQPKDKGKWRMSFFPWLCGESFLNIFWKEGKWDSLDKTNCPVLKKGPSSPPSSSSLPKLKLTEMKKFHPHLNVKETLGGKNRPFEVPPHPRGLGEGHLNKTSFRLLFWISSSVNIWLLY